MEQTPEHSTLSHRQPGGALRETPSVFAVVLESGQRLPVLDFGQRAEDDFVLLSHSAKPLATAQDAVTPAIEHFRHAVDAAATFDLFGIFLGGHFVLSA